MLAPLPFSTESRLMLCMRDDQGPFAAAQNVGSSSAMLFSAGGLRVPLERDNVLLDGVTSADMGHYTRHGGGRMMRTYQSCVSDCSVTVLGITATVILCIVHT